MDEISLSTLSADLDNLFDYIKSRNEPFFLEVKTLFVLVRKLEADLLPVLFIIFFVFVGIAISLKLPQLSF